MDGLLHVLKLGFRSHQLGQSAVVEGLLGLDQLCHDVFSICRFGSAPNQEILQVDEKRDQVHLNP